MGRPASIPPVIEAFFAAWRGGNIDEAVGYLDPEVLGSAGSRSAESARNFLEYVDALGISMAASNCEVVLEATVQCFVEAGWPVADALGLSGNIANYKVQADLITQFNVPDYSAADRRMSSFARDADPDGYATACQNPGPTEHAANGVVYNRACGEFLAGFADALVAEIEAQG